MAEVIALTASLAGIIQLADYGIKFARVLSSLSRQIGTTFEEIEQFGLEVRSFSSLVLLAQTSLRHHCSEHDESPILAYISDNSILDGISRESDIVKRHVRDARRRVAAINSNMRILAVAKWTFHKKSILELSPEMEKIKSSISVILSTVQVELAALSLTRLPADATAERERLQSDLAALKEVIIMQTRAMEDLQRRIDARDRHIDTLVSTLTQQSGARDIRVSQAALVDLARSVVKDETLPGGQPLIPPPSSDNESVSSGKRPPSPPLKKAAVASSTASTASTHLTTPSIISDQRHRRIAPERTWRSMSSESTRSNVSYVAVTDTASLLTLPLHQLAGLQVVKGFVVLPRQVPRNVTARVDPLMKTSIVSSAMADELGLEVKSITDIAGSPWVHLGREWREQCFGTARVPWRRDTGFSGVQMMIDCAVFHWAEPMLIFGWPYPHGLEHNARFQTTYWSPTVAELMTWNVAM